jgi:hypothetical protein
MVRNWWDGMCAAIWSGLATLVSSYSGQVPSSEVKSLEFIEKSTYFLVFNLS